MSVLKHQNLLGLIDLPYTEGDNRAPEWDRYLSLARPLQEEMEKDGVWKPADYIPVLDSTVLSVQVMTADDGRPLHLLELEYPDFTYVPGQFVMIQNQGDGFHWSYPYMIYEGTDRGLKVIAAKNSSLYPLATGAETAIWGANGIGCAPGTNAMFVAEPATIHLLAPLIHACTTPTLLVPDWFRKRGSQRTASFHYPLRIRRSPGAEISDRRIRCRIYGSQRTGARIHYELRR